MSDIQNIQTIKEYHQRTKHHFHKFANALGFMDWATQPDPFRRFLGTPLIVLSLQKSDQTPSYPDIFIPGKIFAQPLSFETISKFFEYSLAISAWKQYGDSRWALRINPSSGNLHPTEGYAVLPSVAGISEHPGIYHYAPHEHALEKRAEFSQRLWTGLKSREPGNFFLLALTSIAWREAWKYGERAYRYCQHDCGHALMAASIASRILGWRISLVSDISDEEISGLLGLDRRQEFHQDEKEWPELLALVSCNPIKKNFFKKIPEEFINGVKNSKWFGRANILSAQHHNWELIDQANDACEKPLSFPNVLAPSYRGLPLVVGNPDKAMTGPPTEAFGGDSEFIYDHAESAYQIIKKRRSAVEMDGQTFIDRAAFFRILRRVSVRFTEIPWSPMVHLGLFVHRVNGLKQGIYVLIREPKKVDLLKTQMHKDFHWEKSEGCGENFLLFFLKAGNYIDASKTLSCTQDIAGDGVFSLGMIAEFDAPLKEFGAWFYKRLFWETGMIGQLLYLEAQASGISATGIGCFFDDPVHEIFGLQGDAFQSLYHFTLGGAVEDKRLTTLPPYDMLSVKSIKDE